MYSTVQNNSSTCTFITDSEFLTMLNVSKLNKILLNYVFVQTDRSYIVIYKKFEFFPTINLTSKLRL